MKKTSLDPNAGIPVEFTVIHRDVLSPTDSGESIGQWLDGLVKHMRESDESIGEVKLDLSRLFSPEPWNTI